MSLAAGHLPAPGLSPDLLLRRFRAPRPAPAAAQLRTLRRSAASSTTAPGRELAMSIQVDSAFVVPTETPDLANTISLITRITKDDPRVVLADCQAHKTFCWVARKADAETVERIRALNLQGIHFQKEPKRFYPEARTGGAGARLRRHGRSGPERTRARIQSATARQARQADDLGRRAQALVCQRGTGTRSPATTSFSPSIRTSSTSPSANLQRGDGRDQGHRRHGDRGKSAHRRNSRAHQPADVQSQYSTRRSRTEVAEETAPSATSTSPARPSRW